MPTEDLRPSSDVSQSNVLRQPSSGSYYEKIIGGSDVTYYLYVDIGKTGIYRGGLANMSTSSGRILSVKVTINTRNRYSGGDNSIYASLWIGGTAYYSEEQKVTSTTRTNFYFVWHYNPSTGNAWSFADINSLDIGFKIITKTGQVVRVFDYTVTVYYDTTTDDIDGILSTAKNLDSIVIPSKSLDSTLISSPNLVANLFSAKSIDSIIVPSTGINTIISAKGG